MDYVARKLRNNEKIIIAGYGNTVKGFIDSLDNIVLIPLDGAVKVGDWVYCKIRGWLKVREVTAINGQTFTVKEWADNLIDVDFENVYGRIYEIKKRRYDGTCTQTYDVIKFYS